jgi:hypothetical protein
MHTKENCNLIAQCYTKHNKRYGSVEVGLNSASRTQYITRLCTTHTHTMPSDYRWSKCNNNVCNNIHELCTSSRTTRRHSTYNSVSTIAIPSSCKSVWLAPTTTTTTVDMQCSCHTYAIWFSLLAHPTSDARTRKQRCQR